jgi:putative transcriptional regulator
MAIIINLDVEMAKNKISLKDLAAKIDISVTNLSLLKTGKVKGIRFDTLEALCRELNCKPGDILDISE